MRSGCALLAAAMLALAAPNVRAEDFCSTCEVQLGLGGTYHWVGWSHGIVAPIIFTFDHDRWEFGRLPLHQGTGLLRLHLRRRYPFRGSLLGLFLRAPAGAVPAKALGVFCGGWGLVQNRAGPAVFLLVEFRRRGRACGSSRRQGWTIELVGRHWSNGGLKLPNHGQDFATLTFSVYPGLFGHAATE